MRRPWQVWLTFGACAVIALGALAWLTRAALHADVAHALADRREELSQRVNLALWRMDTKLAPMIAEEVARPTFFYRPVLTVGNETNSKSADGRLPSPLLTGPPANVTLNFVATPQGEWSSPQAPAPELEVFACSNGLSVEQQGSNRGKLDELARQVDVNALLAQLPQRQLPAFDPSPAAASGALATTQSPSADNAYYGNDAFALWDVNQQAAPSNAAGDDAQVNVEPNQSVAQQAAAPQRLDLQQRASRYQSSTQQELVKQRRDNSYNFRLQNAPANRDVTEGISRPVWINGQLLLARRVQSGGQVAVQGSWLDWPAIRADLLAEVHDLLPDASLAPVTDVAAADPTRMLAGLPVMIEPGEKLIVSGASPAMRWALSIGWVALAVALAAVAALLAGVLALSERRAVFVSAVTHELRTPLTTFRMYAEMLAGGMVPDEARRREYLATLRTEAERLSRLVENVLSYARLERGRGPRRTDRVTAGALVERFASRLRERAEQAQMQLVVNVSPDAAAAKLLTDAGVVEQIVFNLVDNAAKYAGRAEDRRIHLDGATHSGVVRLTVRDHGPGFSPEALARGGAPFRKSAQEAAETAPGVGLGLALCRRLAKQLGGALEIAPSTEGLGATVTLRLPRES
ncbi:MAG: HAMP domain-containing histidine kinase [Planctomycetales bacterium]|nr:HAMP domain-containing histidine kinase [Planctomycetales bacterium]